MSIRSAGDVRRYSYRAAGRARRLVRTIGGVAPVSWLLSRTAHHIDHGVFRITKGRHTFVSLISGLPIVMLTTTGARTGRQGTVPVVGIPDGDRLVVVASNYGQQHHPAWYHNLIANPRATISVAGARKPVRARLATGEERSRLWALDSEIYPARNAYRQRATSREIGIFVLEDASADSSPPIVSPTDKS